MHLWNDHTIHMIGSSIGNVKEIHSMKYSFEIAEMTIELGKRRAMQESLAIKEGEHKHNVWIHESKIIIVDDIFSSDSDGTDIHNIEC